MVFSIILVAFLAILMPVTSSQRKAVLFPIFVFSVILCVIMSYREVNLYPASNALVLAYGISRDIVLSRLL
ncbi:MAG: hypothetical protein M1129_03215 [Candidatus Thermoplasmatota archaeon]|jgi:uncharacterized membrane protein|nr:hypothetical protein [Candidatus Thermoplasmatota archaeon]MCL5954849.1 hypothetical protein [Candidatus Thermoplasmatota archaeon]